jgi:hypothetical protein
MPSLLQVAKKYGVQVVTPNAALPWLALEAAQAVASGHASAKDADKVYVAYFDSVMVRSRAQSPSSRKVQVSKLRQIMLLAEERPTQAPKLLLRVEKMHRQLAREMRSSHCSPLWWPWRGRSETRERNSTRASCGRVSQSNPLSNRAIMSKFVHPTPLGRNTSGRVAS